MGLVPWAGLTLWPLSGRIRHIIGHCPGERQRDAPQSRPPLEDGHRLRHHWQQTGEPGIVVAAFDTELFGHWWFEGPQWVSEVVGRPVTDKTPQGRLAYHVAPVQYADADVTQRSAGSVVRGFLRKVLALHPAAHARRSRSRTCS